MKNPSQTQPVLRTSAPATFSSGILPQACSFMDKAQCTLEGSGVALSCMAGPEVCIPAAIPFVASCKDCIEDSLKGTICLAYSAYKQIPGAPRTPVLDGFCNY